jgi:hypothetical protein
MEDFVLSRQAENTGFCVKRQGVTNMNLRGSRRTSPSPTPSRSALPVALHLASFRAYASSVLLPAHLQGSISGSWLAITLAGFPPAILCGIARPQQRGG